MLHRPTVINRELARWLPLLPPLEVKALLALMLQATPAGLVRTSPETLGGWIGEAPKTAGHLLALLARRKLVHVTEHGKVSLVAVRAFLGEQGTLPFATRGNLRRGNVFR